MPVPYTFGTATASIPLSQLDSNFATAITIGNTAVQLGNTVTTLNNMTLANVTISSGNVTITNVSVTTANVSGTANVQTLAVTQNATVAGNATVTGNVSMNVATITTANVSGTANVSSLVVLTNETVLGNTSVTGNVTAALFSGSGASLSSLNASNVTSGTIATARLASGTASSSTYLRGDQTWATITGTSPGGSTTQVQYNSSGSFAGSANLTFDGTNLTSGGTVSATKLIPTGSSVTGNGLYLPAANALGLSTNGTNAVYIDSSQNVGIGTSSPSSKLNLADSSNTGFVSTLTFSANNSLSAKTDYVQFKPSVELNTSGGEAGGYTLQIKQQGSYKNSIVASGITNNSGNYLAFSTTNEAMRIDSSGFVYMNTTSNWSGNAILNVVGANWVVSGYSTGTATNTGAFLSRVDNTNCRLMMFYYGATTNVGYITTNGTTTSYGSASDYRLKENIAPMTGALAKVALLKPVTYTWKSDGSDGQGFIAHELQEVVPNCVAGEKDAVDAEGNPQYQAVDTSFLVATLTAAIQEQQALITALTARITALESK